MSTWNPSYAHWLDFKTMHMDDELQKTGDSTNWKYPKSEKEKIAPKKGKAKNVKVTLTRGMKGLCFFGFFTTFF